MTDEQVLRSALTLDEHIAARPDTGDVLRRQARRIRLRRLGGAGVAVAAAAAATVVAVAVLPSGNGAPPTGDPAPYDPTGDPRLGEQAFTDPLTMAVVSEAPCGPGTLPEWSDAQSCWRSDLHLMSFPASPKLTARFDANTGGFTVSLTVDPALADQFRNVTRTHVGEMIGIVWHDKVLMVAELQSELRTEIPVFFGGRDDPEGIDQLLDEIVGPN